MKNLLNLFKREKRKYKFNNPCYLCDVSIMNLGTAHMTRYTYYLSEKFNDFILFDIIDKRFVVYCPRGENKRAREYFSDRYLCAAIIEKDILNINDNFSDHIMNIMSSPYVNNDWISYDDINISKLYDQYRRIKRIREKYIK